MLLVSPRPSKHTRSSKLSTVSHCLPLSPAFYNSPELTPQSLPTTIPRDMPNLTVATPTGAFYVLPEVDHYFSKKSKGGAPLTDSTAFCVALLDETGVALVPGEAFGAPKAIVRPHSRPTTHDPRPSNHNYDHDYDHECDHGPRPPQP